MDIKHSKHADKGYMARCESNTYIQKKKINLLIELESKST